MAGTLSNILTLPSVILTFQCWTISQWRTLSLPYMVQYSLITMATTVELTGWIHVEVFLVRRIVGGGYYPEMAMTRITLRRRHSAIILFLFVSIAHSKILICQKMICLVNKTLTPIPAHLGLSGHLKDCDITGITREYTSMALPFHSTRQGCQEQLHKCTALVSPIRIYCSKTR